MKKADVIQPTPLSIPIANAGQKNTIPLSATGTNLASISEGFPQVTFETLPPKGQDMNGLFYLTSDIKCFLQAGNIITYNATTAATIGGYPKDAILGYFDSAGTFNLVQSLIDDNTNNFVSDPTLIDGVNWKLIKFAGNSRNIGEIVVSSIPLSDATLHLADGALLSGTGAYAAFVNYIASIYDADANYFCTENEWQAEVAANGVCGKYVYNSVNNTLRLPNITGILEGTLSSSTLGNTIQAGLPQHTHTRGTMDITGTYNPSCGGSNQGKGFPSETTASGAFSKTSLGSNKAVNETSSAVSSYGINFKASNNWSGSTSSANYTSTIATTTTVQPQTVQVYYYIVVATSVKTNIEVDIDEIATDLNGKADIDLSNLTTAGENKFEGVFVSNEIWWGQNVTIPATGGGGFTVGLSSYLPNDGKKYMVLYYVEMTANATGATEIMTGSDLVTGIVRIGSANQGGRCSGAIWMPVGTGRNITISSATGVSFTASGRLMGYRKMGG